MSVQLSNPNRLSHLPRILIRATLLVVPAVLLVTFFAVRFRHLQASEEPASTNVSAAATEPPASPIDLSTDSATRPVFPYSIVPGGVGDAQELQSAAVADPVVARHYADFRIPLAHPIRFAQPQSMFVSYRRDNRVFWTKKRMLIPAGETLLTDGENLSRVRCANRLSPVAMKPTAAADPTNEELSEPIFVPPLIVTFSPGDRTGFFPDLPSGDPQAGLSGSPSDPGTPSFPPILFPGTPPILVGSPVIPPPVASTPDPPAFVLLFSGFAFLLLIFILIRRFLPS